MIELYDFAVLNGDEVIVKEESIALPDMKAAWSQVERLARSVDEKGCRIRVTDAKGEIVILVGVSSARHTLAASGVLPAAQASLLYR